MFRRLSFKKLMAVLLLFFFCASYAEANIVVRAVLVNPSSQKRNIPFKSHLPKEVKPENVMDMGDLEIGYDPKEACYYVFKDYTLGPKESLTVEIELEDVWKISSGEITTLRGESAELIKILANTDYYERASYLKHSIESKLNQIELTQKKVNASPGGYISDFRENLKLIEAVKADLVAAKTLVAEAKSIAPALTWKLIIAIVVFLGVLGLVFFIIWQKQIKSLEFMDDLGPRSKKPNEPAPIQEGERRQAAEEQKPGDSDIEKRLEE
jgi:hypothetical protein